MFGAHQSRLPVHLDQGKEGGRDDYPRTAWVDLRRPLVDTQEHQHGVLF